MNSWDNISTFKDIYDIVRLMNTDEFNELLFLKTIGKDILETILRLFAYTECLLNDNSFSVCTGNFNLATIKKESSKYNLFYEFRSNKFVLKKVKDSGDSSDLTFINEKDKILLAFTSKNLLDKNMSFDNMDLTKLFYYGNQYNSLNVNYAVCCNDKNIFYEMIDKSKDTTLKASEKIKMKNMIIIDRDYLKNKFKLFKLRYENIIFEDMLNTCFNSNNKIKKEIIKFRPHQEYTINKTFNLIRESGKDKKYTNILWGHVARSGKSYMAFGLIRKFFETCIEKNLKMNVCIITTAPNETIKQYLEIIELLNLNKMANIITSLDYDFNKQEKEKVNLFIFSKQLLTHKDNKNKVIELFKKYKISLLLADETHNGGSTNLSKDLFKSSFSKCHKIFITATYNKVHCNFDIQETIDWTLEDIQILKTHSLDNVYEDAKRFVCVENMRSDEYKLYPNLSIIGVDNIFTDSDNELLTLFNLKGSHFEHEEKLFDIVKYLLGNVVRNIDLMNRKINQRSVAYYNTEYKKTPVIIIFLPSNKISEISNKIETMINRINQSFEVCKCNTNDSNNSFKKNIDDSVIKARNKDKECVVVLTGTQGHLGISLETCDLVILMNNSNSLDFMFQSMFRCMTESKIGNKQFGYVIDLNLKRSIFSVLEYAKQNNNVKSDLENLENMIKNDVIDFNFTSQLEITGAEKFINRQKMFDDIQKYYNSIKISRIDYYINKMDKLDEKILTNLSLDMLNKIKSLKTHIREDKDKKKDLVFKDEYCENDKSETNKISNSNNISSCHLEKIPANEITYFISSIKYLIPISCIITMDKIGQFKLNLVDMLLYITSKIDLNNILIEQFSTWCGKRIINMDIENLIGAIQNLTLEDREFKQQVEDVSSTIKLLFLETKGDMKEMAKLVEKHLTPSTLEKKKNAEVSTPDKLCKEMLEPLKEELMKEFKDSNGKINRIYKILEPCCGKGIFLLNIYNFLVENSTLSKKQILEECIYFADISPLNIFICKLLLNPNDEYKLNFQLGDSLKMNWEFEFDAVIGNPPYNDASGNKGSGHNIWQYFVETAINKWINHTGYLLYIHPSGWRQVNHKILNLIKENNLIYLEIHNVKDGIKTFGCSTRYDWYLLKKENTNNDTIIKGEDGILYKINTDEWEFIPNMMFDKIKKLLNDKNEDNNFGYYRSNYGSDKKWISKKITSEFTHPVVYSINKNNELSLVYSNTDRNGIFGKSKFIFSNGMGYYCDYDGKYAISEWAYCFYTDSKDMSNIINAFNSKIFENIKKAVQITSDTYNKKVFKLFKKDFYLYL